MSDPYGDINYEDVLEENERLRQENLGALQSVSSSFDECKLLREQLAEARKIIKLHANNCSPSSKEFLERWKDE